jgi:hypothetical protein
MRRFAITLLVGACGARAHVTTTAPDAAIKAILDERIDPDADAARVKATIAPDVIAVNETGGLSHDPSSLISGPAPAVVQLHVSYDDLALQARGDTVIATYHRHARLVLGGAPVSKQWRVIETFARTAAGWQTTAYQETVVFTAPAPHGAPADLDDYVGSYELFPGYDYTVRRDGDRLLFGATASRELVPESPDAFIGGGDPTTEGFGYHVIFEREGGKVTALRVLEYPGVEYTAKRVSSPAPAAAGARAN